MKKDCLHEGCYPHNCEPPKRERPPYCGKVDTAGIGEYYSAHAIHHCHPHCGYDIPPLKPLFVPGMSPQEQIQLIAGRVDEMIHTLNEYNCKVWGAYDEIVHSAICNDAYYSEIVTETGYLSETSAKYTVVHIPFIDGAGEPIYLQLGLAYDNTTNSGLKESVFDASERKIADKLIPAFNVADKWNGKSRWCGAPIPSEDGKITMGVSKNGFIKIYNNSATEADMNKDDIFYAMGVQSVLVSGGKVVQAVSDENDTNQNIGRVGIGMNYDTQERFFILVDGYAAEGVESGGGCTHAQLAELFAKYGCTVAVEVANGDSTCMLDKGELVNIPYETGVTRTSSNTEGGKIPYVPKVNCFWYITKKRHYHNDYVREVGELMQKYGRSIWQGIIDEKAVNALKNEVQNVYIELDKEINDRKEADAALQTGINNLDNRVTNLYNELVAKDTELDGKISKLREDLTTETSERKEADNALQEGVGEAKSLIEQEATARQAGDEENKQLIDKEIADRKTADSEMDKALKALIKAEEDARTAGDENLANQITEVIANLNSFKTKTESDITKIDSDLDTMTASINALSSTVTNNKIDIETKVTNLAARVTANETTTADNVEKIAKINAQINAMQTTISALNETVTALQASFASTEQSFENVKQTVANMQVELNTFEQTVNGKLKELSDKFGEYLPLTGGTMTGAILFDDNMPVQEENTNNTVMTCRLISFPTTGKVGVGEAGGEINNIATFTLVGSVHETESGDSEYKIGTFRVQPAEFNSVNVLDFQDDTHHYVNNDDGAIIRAGAYCNTWAAFANKKRGNTNFLSGAIVEPEYPFTTLTQLQVADGEYDDEAINVKQLNATKQKFEADIKLYKITNEYTTFRGEALATLTLLPGVPVFLVDDTHTKGTSAANKKLISTKVGLYINGEYQRKVVFMTSTGTVNNEDEVVVFAFNSTETNITIPDTENSYLRIDYYYAK